MDDKSSLLGLDDTNSLFGLYNKKYKSKDHLGSAWSLFSRAGGPPL